MHLKRQRVFALVLLLTASVAVRADSFVKDETGQLFLVRKADGREASRVKKIK